MSTLLEALGPGSSQFCGSSGTLPQSHTPFPLLAQMGEPLASPKESGEAEAL